MKRVICFRRRFNRFHSSSPGRQARVTRLGVLGMFALGAQLHLWTAIGIATVGVIVSAASVVAVQAFRRRLRQRANTTQRLGSLGSLTVENHPPEAESSQRPERTASDSGDEEVGIGETAAGMSDRGESRGAIGDPRPDFDEAHEFIDEFPAPSRPPVAALDPAPETIDTRSGGAFTDRLGGDARPISDEIRGPLPEGPTPAGSPTTPLSSQDLIDQTDEADLADLASLAADEAATLFKESDTIAGSPWGVRVSAARRAHVLRVAPTAVCRTHSDRGIRDRDT
jgi:hypothetical protein